MYVLVKSDGPLQPPTVADEPVQTDAFAAAAEPPREAATTAAAAAAAGAAEPRADTGDPATAEGQTDNDNLGNVPDYLAGEFDIDDNDDDDDSFSDIVAYYLCKRNIIASDITDPNHTNKAIVEYVNLKYIENNLRTIGLNNIFDKNNIMEAQLEFKSFEEWFTNNNKCVAKNKYNKDLCLPLFCHLYLNLYSQNNHECMLKFLDEFKHLFIRRMEIVFLQELKNVTDINNLSPRLSVFRKNKYVYSIPSDLLTNLCRFFQSHHMLKSVFQEWFDINYFTNEDEMVIFQDYCKTVSEMNNLKDEEKANDVVFNNDLNNEEPSTSKEYFNEHENFSSQEPNLDKDQLKNKNEKKRKPKKRRCKKSTSTKQTSKNQKKLSNDSSNDSSSQNESKQVDEDTEETKVQHNLSKLKQVDNCENNKPKDPNLFISDKSNMQRQEPNNKEKQKKSRKNEFSSRYKFTDENRSNICRISSEDSSMDSSSQTSFSDEELVHRKYIRNKKKSDQGLPTKTPCHLKPTHVTKIDLKDLNENSHLCTTRQIILNCSKLSCTILTSCCKYVAAGSLDSLIYLWERSKIINSEKHDDLNNTEKKFEENEPTPTDQSDNFIEHLDRSTANILRGHGGSIFDLAEIPMAKILLSASNDKTFRVWDLISKQCLEIYDEYEQRTWCISASPYTLQVATGSCDGVGCLWFLNYKSPLRFFAGHLDDILVIQFHSNQIILATGSADKTIRVFELVTGDCQRLLVGHTDYVNCLEFHDENPNILASASGAGEIIVWDLPTGNILWKLNLGPMLISNLAWLTNSVLLASLTTGVILKCDTSQNYINTLKKIDGFTTKFNRLMSLKIIDNIVYTIGLPGKSAAPKSTIINNQPNSTKKTGNNPQNESTFLGDISPFKLFLPQDVENNDKSIKQSLLGLNTTKMKSSLNDFKDQLTIDPSDTTLLTPDFFKVDLERPPFNLTCDETSKLNSEYQSNKIKLTEKPTKTKTNQQGKRSSSIQKNSKTANTTNSSSKRKNSSNQSITKHVPQQTQMTNAQQIGNDQSPTSVNLQNLQLQNFEDPTVPTINTDTQESLQLRPMQLLQTKSVSSIHKASTSKQHQKKPTPKPVRTRLTTQSVRKNIPQQDQQQLQTRILHKTSTNPSQQYPKIQPKSVPKKKIVQTRQSQQQTSFGLAEMNVAQSLTSGSNTQAQLPGPSTSAAGMPVRVALKQQMSTPESPSSSFETLPPDEYERLHQAVMASLLQTNPGMFSHGQPVISEITRSQPTNQSLEDTNPNLQTESQQNRNLKK